MLGECHASFRCLVNTSDDVTGPRRRIIANDLHRDKVMRGGAGLLTTTSFLPLMTLLNLQASLSIGVLERFRCRNAADVFTITDDVRKFSLCRRPKQIFYLLADIYCFVSTSRSLGF